MTPTRNKWEQGFSPLEFKFQPSGRRKEKSSRWLHGKCKRAQWQQWALHRALGRTRSCGSLLGKEFFPYLCQPSWPAWDPFSMNLVELEALNNWKMARFTGYKISKWRLGQGHTGVGGCNPDRPKCLPHDPGHGWQWRKEAGEKDTFFPEEYGSGWGNQVSGPGEA
jgi:hypothetical protein